MIPSRLRSHDAYTVYIDIWLADLDGTIIANGRPGAYAVIGQSVKDAVWFKRALDLRAGADGAGANIRRQSREIGI